MIGAINTSLSGYKAAVQRVETASNNIANQHSTAKLESGQVSNEPYIPQRVQAVTQGDSGGVTTQLVDANPATIREFRPDSQVADEEGFVETPNVDIARELVDSRIASYDAQANLKAIQIQSKLLESALDIIT